ncbi:reverse transcriptase domain-containing protein [Streptomyces kaempferi]|uniref:Reverse transcriptase domain-containing protein n=1 Tax=Streptomyces kaempferi TaxID=333725 RepID=A0ABW3XUD0_9ACTN
MASGSYFPPAVKAVEIPKAGGKGVRVLGVPTVADRIAQTVAAMYLERRVEPVFHPDSYGYRPRRSALDAVETCRRRCWRNDWVVDLDIRAFFDNVDHELMLKAVERHVDADGKWVLLYVQRWLVAPLAKADGSVQERDRGTPQGSAITPPTQWVTRAWVTLRSVLVLMLAVVGVVFAHGDAVADGDLLGADEHVLDEESQDALALGNLGAFGVVVELGEEAFEVVGKLEVGVPVGD